MDNTALSGYTSCPTKGLFSMFLNRRRGGKISPSLSYGSGWHVCMEVHYKSPSIVRAELYDQVEDGLIDRWQESTNPDDYRTIKRCLVEYDKFVDRFGIEEKAKTLGWPERPIVEQAVELQIPGARHPYTGKIDRIYTDAGQYFIEDHKTASMLRSDYFQQWELDNQMIGYDTLAWQLTGFPIAGVRLALHVIRKSDSVFERKVITFVQSRVENWTLNYDRWLQRIENDLALYKIETANGVKFENRRSFPENFSACSGKYGMCGYASVCSLPPNLRMEALENDFDLAPWNPLEVVEEVTD